MTKHPLEYVTEEVHEISRLQDINAELLAALEPIVDCYGLGLSPEKFCEQVDGFILEARLVVIKARKE